MLLVEKKVTPNFLTALSMQLSPDHFAKLEASAGESAKEGSKDLPAAQADMKKTSDEKKEKQMYSNCQASVLALFREKNVLAMDLIHWFVLPFRSAFSDLTLALRQGHRAVRTWYIKTALGQHFVTLREVLHTKSDVNALADLGFILESTCRSDEDALPDDPCVLEQDGLAKETDKLVLQLLSEHTKEAGTHRFHPISAAAGLLSSSPSDVASVLERLACLHEAWQEAQKHSSPSLQKLLLRSPLACMLEQELLERLASVKFREVPVDIQDMLDHIFGSLGSSLVSELGFQVWEGDERRGCNGAKTSSGRK